MEVLLIGIATAFNFIIIMWKYNRGRISDASVDFIILIALAWMFSGTITGMAVGMVASCVISLYLLISPPKFSLSDAEEELIDVKESK